MSFNLYYNRYPGTGLCWHGSLKAAKEAAAVVEKNTGLEAEEIGVRVRTPELITPVALAEFMNRWADQEQPTAFPLRVFETEFQLNPSRETHTKTLAREVEPGFKYNLDAPETLALKVSERVWAYFTCSEWATFELTPEPPVVEEVDKITVPVK